MLMRGRAKAPADKDPFAVDLGRRIRENRERLGLTQRELSRRASYDAVQLSRVETGDAVPRSDALLRIAVQLETPIGRLYGLPDGVSMVPGSVAAAEAPSAKDVVSRLSALEGDMGQVATRAEDADRAILAILDVLAALESLRPLEKQRIQRLLDEMRLRTAP